MIKVTSALIGFVLAVQLSVAAGECRADDSRPWWKDFHTLVSYSPRKEGREWELGMMAERGAWPTGWYGPWWIQRQVERRGKYDAIRHVEHFRNAGVKNVFYFDIHGDGHGLPGQQGGARLRPPVPRGLLARLG